jgi:hypothetical protein
VVLATLLAEGSLAKAASGRAVDVGTVVALPHRSEGVSSDAVFAPFLCLLACR